MPLSDFQKMVSRKAGLDPSQIEQQFAAEDLRSKYLSQAVPKLGSIVESEGLTPAQRSMLSAAMQRSLGTQAEQAGQGLGRRAAAQGISGTGLANANLAQVQSGLLQALQQGDEGINQKSQDLYMSALQSLLGIGERDRDRNIAMNEAERQRKSNSFGLDDFFGTALGLVGGPFAEKAGNKLFDSIFGE